MKLFLLVLVWGFSLNAITQKTALSQRITDKKTAFSKLRSDIITLSKNDPHFNLASCQSSSCNY
jgi:hypothetical protein